MKIHLKGSTKAEDIFHIGNFDITNILDSVNSHGAVSIKLLKQDFLKELLEEAIQYSYTQEEEYIGSGEKTVIQQLGTFKDFPEDSGFIRLRDRFTELLKNSISGVIPHPFGTELNFNSPELIRYKQGSTGITPHRDGLKYRNLVCIFNISGRGRFFICDDRKGNNPVEFDTTPGNVILMKAPGFMGSDHRPFHFVRDIAEERYVFVLRQGN